jgi:hypothetical protein
MFLRGFDIGGNCNQWLDLRQLALFSRFFSIGGRSYWWILGGHEAAGDLYFCNEQTQQFLFFGWGFGIPGYGKERQVRLRLAAADGECGRGGIRLFQ